MAWILSPGPVIHLDGAEGEAWTAMAGAEASSGAASRTTEVVSAGKTGVPVGVRETYLIPNF
jgi:hypothetical protein